MAYFQHPEDGRAPDPALVQIDERIETDLKLITLRCFDDGQSSARPR